ncbi:MAG: hypothetical protein R3E56_10970 [Burkholderiaceae bacterium]
MGGLAGRNFFVERLTAKWMCVSLPVSPHRAIHGTGKTMVQAMLREQRTPGRFKPH